MRPFLAKSAVIVLALAAGGAAGVAGAAAPAFAVGGTTRYVDSHCATAGDGSVATPFCTISAAVAVAQPGDTVTVEPGTYVESVTLPRSGTAVAPITIAGVYAPGGHTQVGAPTGPVFAVAGVSHVVIKNFEMISVASPAVLISDSSDITVDSSSMTSSATAATVSVTGASANVSITRDYVRPTKGVGIAVDPQIPGVVISTNVLSGLSKAATAVTAVDDPGIAVTSNTIMTACGVGIALTGASTDATIANDIVATGGISGSVCAGAPAAITVAPGSASTTTADYNLIDPRSTGPLYTWGSTTYATLAPFTAATGQGGHDLAVDPQLNTAVAVPGGVLFTERATSPAIDSADANAPGELATDEMDMYRADDPGVSNTGTGNSHADRGASELFGPASGLGGYIVPQAAGTPLTTGVSASDSSSWTTDGPYQVNAFRGDDGKYWAVTRGTSTTVTFMRAGTHCVSVWQTTNRFFTASSGNTCTTVGAVYTSLAPTRLLDTRTSVPVAAGGDVTILVSATGMPAAAAVSAVVLNVTATQPTAAGSLTVFPAGTTLPATSNMNFAAHATVANVVTVPFGNGSIVVHNSSAGTVYVIADLEGYYSGTGDNFAPTAPIRVLDTRHATGVPTTAPLAAGATITLDMSSALPAGAHAAILNVTATGATSTGYLTVFPAGTTLPTASNLNYTSGSTVAAEVIVPVVNGKIQIYNGSSGTTHVIGDVTGWFGSASAGATSQFVPYGPERAIDTRGNDDGPIEPHQAFYTYAAWPSVCGPVCPVPTAYVLNITATQETSSGYLTVYPVAPAPPNSSTLNFVANQTIANATTVGSNAGMQTFNGSTGTLQLIVDEQGYYIDPTKGNG